MKVAKNSIIFCKKGFDFMGTIVLAVSHGLVVTRHVVAKQGRHIMQRFN